MCSLLRVIFSLELWICTMYPFTKKVHRSFGVWPGLFMHASPLCKAMISTFKSMSLHHLAQSLQDHPQNLIVTPKLTTQCERQLSFFLMAPSDF